VGGEPREPESVERKNTRVDEVKVLVTSIMMRKWSDAAKDEVHLSLIGKMSQRITTLLLWAVFFPIIVTI
jgi:hypothetical protein